MDWTPHFPNYVYKASDPEVLHGSRRQGQLVKNIEVADIGCGFGGLLFALAPRMPEDLILGEFCLLLRERVGHSGRALDMAGSQDHTAINRGS